MFEVFLSRQYWLMRSAFDFEMYLIEYRNIGMRNIFRVLFFFLFFSRGDGCGMKRVLLFSRCSFIRLFREIQF